MATWVTSLALVKGASGSGGLLGFLGLGVENRCGCYEVPRLWLRWLVPQEICAARGCGSSVQKGLTHHYVSPLTSSAGQVWSTLEA